MFRRTLSGIVVVTLFCLLLPFEVRSVVLVSLEPHESQFPQILQKESTDSQKLETNSECGTTKILGNLKENWVKSGLEAQSETNYLSLRPTDSAGGIDGNQHLLPKLYNTTNFVFHWTNGTDGSSFIWDAVPLNDSNANGIPDYIENFAEIFENIRNLEVNIKGFPAPPNDTAEPNDQNNRNPDGRYDVFIYIFGFAGYAYPEQWPNSPSYSHIGMRSDYTGYAFPWETDFGVMQATAAHEFFHAIQFVYDCNEEPWWMETTAEYMEDEVYPNVNDNYRRLPYWFQYCDINGLENTEEEHEYGTFIFAKRLGEDFGDGIIKEIWEEMRKPATNGLTAIGNILLTKNTTLRNEFSRFITANFFLEEMYVDGIDYRMILKMNEWTTFKGVWLKYQYNASTAADYTGINGSNTNRGAWMDKWGTSYITMKLDPTRQRYHVFFDGLDLTTDYLVKLVTKKNGVINETLFNLNGTKDGYVDLDYDTFDNVTLIIANAGNAATLNPSWRVTITMPPKPPLPIYDVAIIDLKSSTNYTHPGETINISVTVKNNGTQRNENFNVSTYWGQFQIETEQVTELAPATTKTLNITWTIPSDLNGSEIIWVNATLVSDDASPENNRFENGILTIREGVHDIAIIEMRLARWVISREGNLTISTTIENQGDFTESFNVTTCTDSTVTQTQSVTMASHANTTLTFTWNVTGLTYGNYTICASAWPVPGETDTSDNNFTCGTPVHVGVPGDISGPTQGICDGKCDMRDVSYLIIRFNTKPDSTNWNANADINNDGTVNMRDISIAILNFNKHE